MHVNDEVQSVTNWADETFIRDLMEVNIVDKLFVLVSFIIVSCFTYFIFYKFTYEYIILNSGKNHLG